MSEDSTVYVPIERIGIRRRSAASIAVIGNPNSGKSTLFNRLTGLRQTTGNYPGVTVEKHAGTMQLQSAAIGGACFVPLLQAWADFTLRED